MHALCIALKQQIIYTVSQTIKQLKQGIGATETFEENGQRNSSASYESHGTLSVALVLTLLEVC